MAECLVLNDVLTGYRGDVMTIKHIKFGDVVIESSVYFSGGLAVVDVVDAYGIRWAAAVELLEYNGVPTPIEQINYVYEQTKLKGLVAYVDIAAEKLDGLFDPPAQIQDMVIDAIIKYPVTKFHNGELRVHVYNLFKYPLSSKQLRDCLYRLRVAGWPIKHLGLGKYQV